MRAAFDFETGRIVLVCPRCASHNTVNRSNDWHVCGSCGHGGPEKKFVPDDILSGGNPGLICCGIAYEDEPVYTAGTAPGYLSSENALKILNRLHAVVTEPGGALYSWNGAGFDLRLLAMQLPMTANNVGKMRTVLWFHIDMMYYVVARNGHYLGLDKVAKGMGIEGKLKNVMLSDGTVLDNMSGMLAPELWEQGEGRAVLDYQAEDARVTLELATTIDSKGEMVWRSGTGRHQRLVVEDTLPTVEQCLNEITCYRNTSWMSSPPNKKAMVAWLDNSRWWDRPVYHLEDK